MNTKPLVILLALITLLPVGAIDTLLNDDFSSGSVVNGPSLSTVGSWAGKTISKSINNSRLEIESIATYNGNEEGIVAKVFQITSQTGTTISVSFDYSVVSSSTMYVHFRGVDSNTTAWSLNNGAQNGNVWDYNTGGTTYRFKDGLVVSGSTNANSGSAIVNLSGSGSYSTDIDISGYTLSDVSSYSYMAFGFAFNFNSNGTSWVDNVLLQSYTPVAANIWDAGGGDTNINTATNWTSDSIPTLTGGTSHLEFGSGGSLATVNVSTDIDKITINREADFTIASGGNLTIGGGGIVVSSSTGRSHTITGGVTMSADQTINVSTGETLTFSGDLGGSANVIKDGGGTLNFTASNSFTGDLTLYSGTTNISGSGNLGGGTYSGNIANSAVLKFDSSSDQTLSGIISGTGTFNINGSGTLTLSGANSLSGAINKYDESTLVLSTAGTMSGVLYVNTSSGSNGGTIKIMNSTGLGTKQIETSTGFTLEFGSNGLTIDNNVKVWNQGSSDYRTIKLDLAGTNTGTYSGTFDTRGKASMFYVGQDDTIIMTGSFTNTAGSTALTKDGAGTLDLQSANTGGGIVIKDGIVKLSHASAVGSGNVRVDGGSLLVGNNSALTSKTVTLNSTSTSVAGLSFDGNFSGTIGKLTLSEDSIIDLGTGSVAAMFADMAMGLYKLHIYNWTGTPRWSGGTGADTDKLYFNGTYNLNNIRFYSGAVGSDSFLGSGFDLGWDAGFSGYHIIPVPEPETYITGIILLAGCLFKLWKRKLA